MIQFDTKLLSRYRDLARLLIRYGHSDIVRRSGLHQIVDEEKHQKNGESDLRPEQFARDLEQMGPAYIKLGQILSSRGDLLPPPYLKALARLQDDTEPFAFADVERTIDEELGQPLDRVFPQFARQPLASASLAQVHRAQMRDGTEVIVKVQRPRVGEQIAGDLRVLHQLASFLDHHTEIGARYQFDRIIHSLEHSLLRELDYRHEASQGRRLGEELQDFDRVVVPHVFDELCTRHVLTMEFVAGCKITELTPSTLIEANCQQLADELFRAYLHQVLVKGFFHADPHPGNLMLTRDRKIALIDFGMVCYVPPRLKHQLVKLLLAISEGEGDDAAEVAMEIGRLLDEFDEPEFRGRIARLVAEQSNKPLEQLQAGAIVLEIQAISVDTGMRLPDEVTTLGKTLVNLDEIVGALDESFNPNDALRRRTAEILAAHGKKYLSAGKLYQAILETAEVIRLLPRRINKITENLAENRLEVRVDAFDQEQFMRGLHRIANRISTGIVLASLIIGASLMMQLETTATLFGYPVIAFLFFIIAAVTGMIVVFRAMFSDRRDE